MKIDPDEFLTLKIAALLHDPPHKPFLIAEGGNHLKEAKCIANGIFGEHLSKYLENELVKSADALASSFDRWILSLIMGEDHTLRLFLTKEIKLKNVLEPLLEISISYPDKEKFEEAIKNYVSLLKSVIDKVRRLREKYHLLYAFYEMLWIYRDLPIGPADTRVPTHSIFDHNYATASMINWKADIGGIRGLLVGIDVADTQQFISSSRKLRDLWVSSYLISALTWYTITELVDKLGPDVVIVPSLRMNTFYLHWLKKQPWTPQNLYELLSEFEDLVYLSKNVRNLYYELGIPPYPIMPGRVTLILPPWNYVIRIIGAYEDKDIEHYFERRLAEGWKLLWNITNRYAKARAKEGDVIWRFVYEAFETYKKQGFFRAGFDQKPPLRIRVEAIEVDNDSMDWRLYDKKYQELTIRLAKRKYIREDASVRLALHDLTKGSFDGRVKLGKPKESSKGFDYCTVCGKLPALVIVPRKEIDYKNYIEKFLRNQISDEDFEKLATIFSPGEKLCPWCFLKRVIGLEPKILEALVIAIPYSRENVKKFTEQLVLAKEKEKKNRVQFGFPSVAHIASARLYEKLIKERKIINIVSRVTLRYLPFKLREEVKVISAWPFMRRIIEKFESILKGSINKYDELIVYAIFGLDPENMWFHADRRSAWRELFSSQDLTQWLWRYYTLIRADGDSIGDLLEGRLTAFLLGRVSEEFYYKLKHGELNEEEKNKVKEHLKRYIINSCEGNYKEIIIKCFNIIEKKNNEKYLGELVYEIIKYNKNKIEKDDVLKRVNKALNELERIINEELRIPVTPTYHVAVSSALMRAALLDAAIIFNHDGFVVYAGGDDFLALAPIDRALDIVLESRLIFWGLGSKEINRFIFVRDKPGFAVLKKAYFPMLSGICRSYCIYIAHFRYPLSYIIRRSLTILEKVKRIRLTYYEEGKQQVSRKDVLVVVYNPRGGENYAMIPLSWSRPIIKNACWRKNNIKEIALFIKFTKKLLEYIDMRFCGALKCDVLSYSFLYDFLEPSFKEIVNKLKERLRDPYFASDAESILIKLMKTVIGRNIIVRGGKQAKEKFMKKIWNEIFEPILKNVGLGMWEMPLEENKINKEMSEKGIDAHEKLVLLNLVKTVLLIKSGAR